MKISLIHPSRGRAEKAKQTLNNWMLKSSGGNEIEHILSIDSDDKELLIYTALFDSKMIIGPNDSVVSATNKAAEIATGDILIYLSDDFDCPKDWDKLIVDKNLEGEWLLKVDDGLQRFYVGIVTIPIMSKSLYSRLGYFWHPSYKSQFVDRDLYYTVYSMGYLISAPDITFQHNHYSNGKAEKDATYERNDANWETGKAIFAQRRLSNFPT